MIAIQRLTDRVERAAVRSVELHARDDIAYSQVRRADRYLTKARRTLADAVGDLGAAVHDRQALEFRRSRLPYRDDLES